MKPEWREPVCALMSPVSVKTEADMPFGPIATRLAQVDHAGCITPRIEFADFERLPLDYSQSYMYVLRHPREVLDEINKFERLAGHPLFARAVEELWEEFRTMTRRPACRLQENLAE